MAYGMKAAKKSYGKYTKASGKTAAFGTAPAHGPGGMGYGSQGSYGPAGAGDTVGSSYFSSPYQIRPGKSGMMKKY